MGDPQNNDEAQNEKKGLKGAIQKLEEGIKDIASLHVQTFSGKLTLNTDGEIDFDKIKNTLKDSEIKGDVILVAETLAQFDGDSNNFITSDIENIHPDAIDMHLKAVKTGMETRIALMNLFKGLFK